MNFKPVQLKITSFTQNSYGERVSSLSSGSTIEMSINFLSGNSNEINNVLTATSTHAGLTRTRGIHTGDYIVDNTDTYKVDFVNSAPRLSVVYMTMVKDYE